MVFQHLHGIGYIFDVCRQDRLGGDFRFSTANRNIFLAIIWLYSVILMVNWNFSSRAIEIRTADKGESSKPFPEDFFPESSVLNILGRFQKQTA